MLPTPFWTVLIVSCFLARLPRELTQSLLVSYRLLSTFSLLLTDFYPCSVEMMAETCFLAESALCYPPLFNGEFFVVVISHSFPN